jgi:DNA-binding response OmpR family regulator
MAGKRILLLEDDPDVAELLIVVLHDAEYIVDPARTVAQAESRLAERAYSLVIRGLETS